MRGRRRAILDWLRGFMQGLMGASVYEETAFQEQIRDLVGGIEEALIYLTRQQVEEIIAHAQGELPNEACGLLGGKEGRVEKVYRLSNAEHSPATYRLDPEEQYRAMMDMEERGWNIVAVYHSHIAAPAYPSATDVKMAYYPDSLYLIISLADRERPVLRAFRIVEGEIEEVEWIVS